MTTERYEKMFRWLAEQDFEECCKFSKRILLERYIKEKRLDYIFRKPSKEIAEMIRDSTEFTTATKAKLLILLNIPIKDKTLLAMLEKEDNEMMLRAENQPIFKFCSKNGEVVFHGTRIRTQSEAEKQKRASAAADTNKNHKPSKRAAPKAQSSHDSSLENQTPGAKKTKTEPTGCPLTASEQLVPASHPSPTDPCNQFPTDSNSNSIESRNRVYQNYCERVEKYQKINYQLQNVSNDQYATDFGQADEVADPASTQSVEVNATSHSHQPTPTPSSNFWAAEVEEEQKPALKLPKDEELPRTPTPPVESSSVEETALDKLKRFETPTNSKTVFELSRLFVVCLKEFEHLCPKAINHMIVTLKETLIHFSVFSRGNGILVREVLEDFHDLIGHMHRDSKFLKYVYDHWKKNDLTNDLYGEFITFDLLKITLVGIIEPTV